MSDSTDRNQNRQSKNTTRKQLRYAVVAVAVLLVILLLLYNAGVFGGRSIEQKLADIERDHSIPDKENAAIVYNEIIGTYASTDYRPAFFTDEMDNVTMDGPWSAQQYPKAAKWLKEQQPVVDTLLKAAAYEKCRFSIDLDWTNRALSNRSIAGRECARLLLRSGNFDLGRDNKNAALEKYLAMIQLAKHWCQQSTFIEYLVGIAIEWLGTEAQIRFIIEHDPNQAQLNAIEKALADIHDRWSTLLPEIQKVEDLMEEYNLRKMNFFQRLVVRFKMGWGDSEETMREIYLRVLSRRRGVHIVIALVRHKRKHGEYPEKLGELNNVNNPKILTDPLSNKEFVYERMDSDFKLYGRGKNVIDEGGSCKHDKDDIKVWIPEPNNKVKEQQ